MLRGRLTVTTIILYYDIKYVCIDNHIENVSKAFNVGYCETVPTNFSIRDGFLFVYDYYVCGGTDCE